MNNDVDSVKVRRALANAKMMKWAFPALPGTILIITALLALATGKIGLFVLGGVTFAFFGPVVFYFIGIQFCRCPVCGQKWWSPLSLGFGWLSILMNTELGGDETETYRCRNCGLEIGPHLK